VAKSWRTESHLRCPTAQQRGALCNDLREGCT
jgi:hypothetical protein